MSSRAQAPRKEGELLKFRNLFTGWAKRYFRLERSYLHYFDTKHNHSPLATITRGEINCVKESSAFPGKTNVFEILHSNTTVWYCQAKTTEEMISWMQALSPTPNIIDPKKYAIVPVEQEATTPREQAPISSHPDTPTHHSVAPSPYRDLICETHRVAHASNTFHDCHFVSPPPPYSPEGATTTRPSAPPPSLPPFYYAKK